MLTETIEQLKVKPIPKKQQDFGVIINIPGEGVMPNIIDKTAEKIVDREDFFSKIAANIGIVQKDFKQKPKSNEKIPVRTSKTIPDAGIDLESTVDPEDPQSIKYLKPSPVPGLEDSNDSRITNIVKTSQKIVIREIESSEVADSGVELPPKKRLTPKPKTKAETIDETLEIPKDLRLGRTLYLNRIPKTKPNILIKAPDYYLYNRETFISFINSLFAPYKAELLKQEQDLESGKISIDCNQSDVSDFSLLTHQKIVRDYINLYTPYRGLLLYHGLGSGKTCSSIAIAEGIKNDKKIMVLTPASLRANYIEELKKCGDYLYKKNQFWEFISIKTNPKYLEYLSTILKLPQEFITKNGGAWFINVKKEPNYDSLDFEHQKMINEQIDKMISYKYEFINYNGLRGTHLTSMSHGGTVNPFSNKVIIIDEAHNFISRIVNKLRRKTSLSMKLYNYLMEAENCKIILLTGTPIINYPNEIGILFNILRGSIKTYSCKLILDKATIDTGKLEQMFKKDGLYGYIDDLEYNSLSYVLKITQNPFGYVRSSGKKKLVYTTDPVTSEEFIDQIKQILTKNGIGLHDNAVNKQHFKALPDTLDDFKKLFIDANNNVMNPEMFKMRIVGLTSYFRSAQEQLMPKYDHMDSDDFKVIEIPMSKFQFGVYEEARVKERKLEEVSSRKKAKNKLNEIYDDSVSTYRIFSRAFCNFVFPRPDIKRPMPKKDASVEAAIDDLDTEGVDGEEILDDLTAEEKVQNVDGKYEADDITGIKKDESLSRDNSYQTRIQNALIELEKNSHKYLSKQGLLEYSPKFLHILENMIDDDHRGIHLLYSQFKTLEGIGIFKLVLKENNFAEFKIRKEANGEYVLALDEKDFGKPMFAGYTGSETPEEREIIKNVLNSNWKLVPASIVNRLQEIAPDNNYGQIIKVLMITSSGAEGISLKNVRYVHLMEPYWHPVRIQQVIGRARRICSHSELPKELQTVKVFLYLMKFSEEILASDTSIELRLKDVGKRDKKQILTSDQFLYEISSIKEELNREILTVVKESAIDCSIHTRSGTKDKEALKCFVIGNPSENKAMYVPNIADQDTDKTMERNKRRDTVELRELEINGTKYAYNEKNKELYDYDSYLRQELLLLGKLVRQPDGKHKFEKI
jgi:hypothetical protein